jgi:hypothetical protein
MARKADFNAEEWSTLVEAPLLAGLRVAAASRGGTVRESLAMGQAYAQARGQHGTSDLLDELVAAPPTLDPRGLSSAGDLPGASAARLREALRVLRERAPDEVAAYRGFVLTVARAVAVAHREGGFLGVGGQDVSTEEEAALAELERALEDAPPA